MCKLIKFWFVIIAASLSLKPAMAGAFKVVTLPPVFWTSECLSSLEMTGICRSNLNWGLVLIKPDKLSGITHDNSLLDKEHDGFVPNPVNPVTNHPFSGSYDVVYSFTGNRTVKHGAYFWPDRAHFFAFYSPSGIGFSKEYYEMVVDNVCDAGHPGNKFVICVLNPSAHGRDVFSQFFEIPIEWKSYFINSSIYIRAHKDINIDKDSDISQPACRKLLVSGNPVSSAVAIDALGSHGDIIPSDVECAFHTVSVLAGSDVFSRVVYNGWLDDKSHFSWLTDRIARSNSFDDLAVICLGLYSAHSKADGRCYRTTADEKKYFAIEAIARNLTPYIQKRSTEIQSKLGTKNSSYNIVDLVCQIFPDTPPR